MNQIWAAVVLSDQTVQLTSEVVARSPTKRWVSEPVRRRQAKTNSRIGGLNLHRKDSAAWARRGDTGNWEGAKGKRQKR
jgi:hypothetical protein